MRWAIAGILILCILVVVCGGCFLKSKPEPVIIPTTEPAVGPAPECIKLSIAELKEFLATDNTNELDFSDWGIPCAMYTRTLQQNAKEKGYCAYQYHLDILNRDMGHAIVGFLTKEGMVWVEPQTDEIICGIYIGMDYAPYLKYDRPLIIESFSKVWDY